MIRLYNSTETVFTHNKTVLKDALNCTVHEVANGEFSLELEYPLFQAINRGDVISAPTPKGEQPFRVYRIVKNLNTKTIYARHIFYDLANNFLVDVRPTNLSCQEALSYILSHTESPTSFTGVSNITGSNTAYYVRMNPIQAIIGAENSVLNLYGGNLVRNGKQIDIKASGLDRGYEIRLGKNLIGIEDDSDYSSVYTRLYPTVVINNVVYALPEKYVDSPLIGSYREPIYKPVEVALTEEEGILPLVDIYILMRAYCNNLYSVDNIDKPIANYKVDFVQLKKISRVAQTIEYTYGGLSQMAHETIATLTNEQLSGVTTLEQFLDLLEQLDIYDIVTINVESKIKASVIAYDFDCLSEKYTSLELGGFKPSAQYQTANIVRQMQTDLANQKGRIASAIDYATNLITGNKGGYIVTRKYPDGTPYEILVMNTNDIQTATDVIRINQAGIGFSQTGYNGPFTTAITIDGKVVAGTGFFNSLVTNLITSNEIQVGGRNLISNSGFQDGLNGWTVSGNGISAVTGYPDMPSTCAVKFLSEVGTSRSILQTAVSGFSQSAKKWTVSGYIRNANTILGASPYAGIEIKITYTDLTAEYFAAVDQALYNYAWKSFSKTIDSNPSKSVLSIRAAVILRDVSGNNFYVSSLKVEEGNIATAWIPSPADQVGKSEVISSINLSQEQIKIQAQKLTLEGLTTINNNFKVLLDGSIEAVNAKLSGAITATKMVAPLSNNYYGEIGVSDGSVGLGLYDLQHNIGPYVKLIELLSGTGFALMDTNNIVRLSASLTSTILRNADNKMRFSADASNTVLWDVNEKSIISGNGATRTIFSPNTLNYINVSNTGIQVVINGVTKASW